MQAPQEEVRRSELTGLSQEEDFQNLVAPPTGDDEPPASNDPDKGTKRDISTTTANPLHDKRLRSTTRTIGGEAAPQPNTISILSLFSGIATDIRVLVGVLARLGMLPWIAKMYYVEKDPNLRAAVEAVWSPILERLGATPSNS